MSASKEFSRAGTSASPANASGTLLVRASTRRAWPDLQRSNSSPATRNRPPAGVARAAVMRAMVSLRCRSTARSRAGSSGSWVLVRWSIRDFTPDLHFFVAYSFASIGHGAAHDAHRAGSSAAQRAVSW
ncbi:hypothetical protein [Streptomyces sp. NBC_00243]|uniref:hypothetical protein n=1 Tax=Streptomyces sp. NBC_00243 TaxID=2975688 RepID=UPI003FA3661A